MRTDFRIPPPLDAKTRDRLAALVAAIGEAAAARKLGLSRSTLARALAGLGLRTATRTVIGLNLRALVGDQEAA